jgi:hypothetical protein
MQKFLGIKRKYVRRSEPFVADRVEKFVKIRITTELSAKSMLTGCTRKPKLTLEFGDRPASGRFTDLGVDLAGDRISFSFEAAV